MDRYFYLVVINNLIRVYDTQEEAIAVWKILTERTEEPEILENWQWGDYDCYYIYKLQEGEKFGGTDLILKHDYCIVKANHTCT